MAMETLSEATARLARDGYVSSFGAERGGVRCFECNALHDAAATTIDQIVRFEGVSDPADEAIVFALSCTTCGAKGTYTTGYGVDMSTDDAELARRLIDRRR